MKEFWDERYKDSSYVYGKEPNEFLKLKLPALKPGKILFPAEGEGRNAVFAAKEGWEVSAFDQSAEGRKKALSLAEEAGVELEYQVTELEHYRAGKAEFDAIALIYAHFPPKDRLLFFRKLADNLKEGGILIFEGFGKGQSEFQRSNPSAGGPKDPALLFSGEELREAFDYMEFLEFYEGEVDLNEGEFHKGKGWAIRILARKMAI